MHIITKYFFELWALIEQMNMTQISLFILVCDGDGTRPCLKLNWLSILCKNDWNKRFFKSKKWD